MLLLNGGAIVALLAYLDQAANGPTVAKHATFSLGAQDQLGNHIPEALHEHAD